MPIIPPHGASVEILHLAAGKKFDQSLFQQAQKRFDEELHKYIGKSVCSEKEYEGVRDAILDAVPYQAEVWLKEEFGDQLPAPNEQMKYIGRRCEQYIADLIEGEKDLLSVFNDAMAFIRNLEV